MATSPPNPNQIKSLLLANPPSSLDATTSDDNAPVVDAQDKVFYPMAVAELTAPATLSRPDQFRPRTASVFICLFEVSRGDLRVILSQSLFPLRWGQLMLL